MDSFDYPLLNSKRAPGEWREYYGFERALLGECPSVGWSRFDRASTELAAHTHGDSYEICYIVRGTVEWWAGSQIFQVGPRDIYITRPGEVHGGVDAFMHPCELYWVHVRPGNALYRRLAGVTYRHFRGGPILADHFERLLAEHRNGLPPASKLRGRTQRLLGERELAIAAARSALRLLVLDTLRFHDAAMRQPDAVASPSPPVLAAMQWMHRHFYQPDCLEQTITNSGLGGTQFRRRFRAETGFSPHEYLMRAQVEAAKRQLIEGDLAITELAFELGFSSSQYFATVFRKLVGLTPQSYRQQHTEKT